MESASLADLGFKVNYDFGHAKENTTPGQEVNVPSSKKPGEPVGKDISRKYKSEKPPRKSRGQA